MTDLNDIRKKSIGFDSQRGLNQFHNPKYLILALNGETDEVAEEYKQL